jgi:hypothetical protein
MALAEVMKASDALTALAPRARSAGPTPEIAGLWCGRSSPTN